MMRPATSTGFRMVNHQLARMDLPTGNIHLVSHLKGTFFYPKTARPVRLASFGWEVGGGNQFSDTAGATRALSCFVAFFLQPACSVLWSQYESCHQRGRL